MHVFKVILSSLLILVSLWAMFLPPVFPSSVHAVVNARAYQLNSISSGVVTELLVRERGSIEQGRPVVVVARDHIQLNEDLILIKLELEKAQEELLAVTVVLSEYGVANTVYRTSELGDMDLELSLLKQQLVDADAAVSLATQTEEQYRALFNKQIITSAEFQEAQLSKISVKRNRNELKVSVTRLAAKRNQLLVTDFNRQSPSEGADAKHQSLVLRQSTLQAEVNSAAKRLDLLKQDLVDGGRQLISTPIGGVVWKVDVIEGQPVTHNQEILSIAHGDGVFVEAFLARHFLDAIAIGDRAIIYLNNNRKFYKGTIREIKALEANVSHSEGAAIASVSPGNHNIKLKIEVDDNQISVDQIGHLGKVIVTSAEPSLAEKILVALSIALRTSA